MSTTVPGRVDALGVLAPGAPVVVAFSGGRDSLCLLDVAVTLAGADAVLAVHVHHGLRGRDADEDARAATALAGRLGCAARVTRLAVPDAVRGAGGSPVPWARDARRAALRSAADAWGGPGTPVLVAHTASDQAETVLLRAISSPGTRALAGIAERDDPRGVVRPLLAAGVTRAEAGAWCAARSLRWRDDPTNPTTPRGRVRALLEGLEGIDGRATAALGRTAALAREDDDALWSAADALLATATATATAGAGAGEDRGAPDDGGTQQDDGRTSDHGGGGDRAPGIAIAALDAAPTAVGRRVLRRLAEAAVGAPCPRVGARLAEVLALRPAGGAPAALDLGDGARAVVRDGRLRCVRSPPR